MSYKIRSFDLVDTVTRHSFTIKIGEEYFDWYFITDIDAFNTHEYNIEWKSNEPEDIDEWQLIDDLFESLNLIIPYQE